MIHADTDLIKEATELYMKSWVIPLIEAIRSGKIEEWMTLL